MVGARRNMSVVPAWKPEVAMLSEIRLGAICEAVPAAGIKCVRSAQCVQYIGSVCRIYYSRTRDTLRAARHVLAWDTCCNHHQDADHASNPYYFSVVSSMTSVDFIRVRIQEPYAGKFASARTAACFPPR